MTPRIENRFITQQLSCYFDQVEDRLLLMAHAPHGQLRTVALTRRLTERLINAFATLLMDSSALAMRAPTEARADVVLLEHLSAVTTNRHFNPPPSITTPAASAMTTQSSPAPNNPSIPLISSLQVQIEATAFHLHFHTASDEVLILTLQRPELHCLLELLRHYAEVANWNIVIETAWFITRPPPYLIN
ncbi:hypothetical protein [Thiospirillum jenense]|uniref:Uncharacterized protein n=1 Tax=Thiospirillum jenense TaxID=1653858 RepID=A0A839HEU7_9GAMM|nr:hypothetical protein [Thiospirillum jenense]MBB1126640.1 hypothetical protein [Thiospirillum jenense]